MHIFILILVGLLFMAPMLLLGSLPKAAQIKIERLVDIHLLAALCRQWVIAFSVSLIPAGVQDGGDLLGSYKYGHVDWLQINCLVEVRLLAGSWRHNWKMKRRKDKS